MSTQGLPNLVLLSPPVPGIERFLSLPALSSQLRNRGQETACTTARRPSRLHAAVLHCTVTPRSAMLALKLSYNQARSEAVWCDPVAEHPEERAVRNLASEVVLIPTA
jgi:hypothetical protein